MTKGSAAIGRMVAGQVARTAITAAGSAVGAVTERAGRRKVAHTSGPVTTPAPAPSPASPPDLRAVPEPAPAKLAGDPVAPAKKAAAPSPADVAKVAAKKAPPKKTAARKVPATKTAAKKSAATKDPGAPGDRLPARKKPQPAPKQEQNPESR
ncbi:MAG: hypothetical protein ABIQ59_09930 [Nocardioidaceae bacterium]